VRLERRRNALGALEWGQILYRLADRSTRVDRGGDAGQSEGPVSHGCFFAG
jgi:hypothetical protein